MADGNFQPDGVPENIGATQMKGEEPRSGFNWGMLSYTYENNQISRGSANRRKNRPNERVHENGQRGGRRRGMNHEGESQQRNQPRVRGRQQIGKNSDYASQQYEKRSFSETSEPAASTYKSRNTQRQISDDSDAKNTNAERFQDHRNHNKSSNRKYQYRNQPRRVAGSNEKQLDKGTSNDRAVKSIKDNYMEPADMQLDLQNQSKFNSAFESSKEIERESKKMSTKGKIVNGKYVRNNGNNEKQDRNDTDEYAKTSSSHNDNWRQKLSQGASHGYNSKTSRLAFNGRNKKKSPINSEQARVLTEQLCMESYECMVCCERIRCSHPVWGCQNCYHLFHLKCIKLWASSESSSLKDDTNGWRCPGCQNVTSQFPMRYSCFCGKVIDPFWNPRDGITPHSCGEICQKHRNNTQCSHTCNELCHPGPCPSCPVMVTKECPCGKTRSKMRCGQTNIIKCSNVCGKKLVCKQHTCNDVCHEGPCNRCTVTQTQRCYCGKETRKMQCGDGLDSITVDEDGTQRYSCGKICSGTLDCGNHTCNDVCHVGNCVTCGLQPEKVKYCPCKQTLLSDLLPVGEERQSCLDAIPCCENFCGKKLPCGTKGQSHFCKRSCHIGDCGPCDGTMTIPCRCGNTETEIPCKEYDPDKEFTCEKRCNKKRKCGRHRCNQKCCVESEHNCNLICGRKLGCGLHKCDELCHTGNCPRCWQTSFEERFCYCGETIQYPPIPCGTPLPVCDRPCTRQHPCNHEPKHTCHSEDSCPPCVVLVEKFCLCNREVRRNVPCHVNLVSCGKPCGKDLPCGQHRCPKICHRGACLEDGEICQQPCTIIRRDCPHPCNAPCHFGEECQEGLCKSQITIRCKCGRKSEKVLCLAGNSKVQFQRFATDSVGDKLRNLRSGQTVDISGLMIAEKRGGLNCDDECAIIDRNKRLAEALGIENPDENHFHSPLTYSFFLKDEAKKNLPLVKMIEDAIETLIQKIKKSSMAQLSHSFQPMNSTQRKIVHELAGHYNCKTISYDQEPKRNTVVTATRESFLVGTKLSSIVERKSSKPLPNPILSVQEKPLHFQRMQKKDSQDDLRDSTKMSVDYFGDDIFE